MSPASTQAPVLGSGILTPLGSALPGRWGHERLLVQGRSQDVLAIRRELHKGHRRVVIICRETARLSKGVPITAPGRSREATATVLTPPPWSDPRRAGCTPIAHPSCQSSEPGSVLLKFMAPRALDRGPVTP